jgi:hypothetical protein
LSGQFARFFLCINKVEEKYMCVNTIFLDMDGVIADFTKGAKKIEAIEGTKVDWPKVKTRHQLLV